MASNQLWYDIELGNFSEIEQEGVLQAALDSFNESIWTYPCLPDTAYKLSAGELKKLSFGPFEWTPGHKSYWWPNQPYKDGYRAQLHLLNLTIKDNDSGKTSTDGIRFGFREIRQNGSYFELNGIRIKFRGDNLQVANYDNIDYNGKGDSIHTLPGFLPPSETNPGWHGAVDNFLRLNYNVQREHMVPWTPYMIDVCDEMGLMLIGESACRWNGFDMEDGRGFYEIKCLKDIIKRDRNHPSIIRWSTKNEAQCDDPAYHMELYEAVKELDDTRPIFEEILFADRETYNPENTFGKLLEKDDFSWMEHYLTTGEDGEPYFTSIEYNDALVPVPNRPYGITESNWFRSSTPAGLIRFATSTAIFRAKGASDIRPYTLLSSWVSCIPGCRTTDLLTEECRHPVYGEDNLPDPFSHPAIKLLQNTCNPLFAFDYDFWYLNRKSNAFGAFPVIMPEVECDSDITRTITVCNDDLFGEKLELLWELREGSPSNLILQDGKIPMIIPVAGIETVDITFHTPAFDTFVFLQLKIIKDGVVRFVCNNTAYETINGKPFFDVWEDLAREFM